LEVFIEEFPTFVPEVKLGTPGKEIFGVDASVLHKVQSNQVPRVVGPASATGCDVVGVIFHRGPVTLAHHYSTS
jgi:hypothetical protein